VAFWDEGNLTPPYLILSIILFSLTFPCESKINKTPWEIIKNTAVSWTLIAGLLIMAGKVTGYINIFSPRAVELWLWLTPVCLLLSIFGLRASAPLILKIQGPQRRAVVVGMNSQGVAIAESLLHNQYAIAKCIGFFDDRPTERLSTGFIRYPILGKLTDIAEYVKKNQINVIYISLPMTSQPRIIKLLDELKDTTTSIYFLPDIFLTDLIQGRMGQVDGIPVVAVCETPFTGIDGMIKRIADIGFSSIMLIVLSPLLLAISLGVKLTSPGPIIFKQRRYGLDGNEILVYKFRSMTTCDNGSNVVQATKHDARITPFGGFLRKTSLDELPQFINVLQGRMSIVGPRPHAVAHNELYRKLIKGYMVRHKVKPGITGWAQVNGLRGETDTLDKMQARIEHDIDYLRNWSPRLDVYILFKTVWVLARGQDGAY
jgi:putative colanic acid biosynthesis UDP-glucose lipid carrier transferase